MDAQPVAGGEGEGFDAGERASFQGGEMAEQVLGTGGPAVIGPMEQPVSGGCVVGVVLDEPVPVGAVAAEDADVAGGGGPERGEVGGEGRVEKFDVVAGAPDEDELGLAGDGMDADALDVVFRVLVQDLRLAGHGVDAQEPGGVGALGGEQEQSATAGDEAERPQRRGVFGAGPVQLAPRRGLVVPYEKGGGAVRVRPQRAPYPQPVVGDPPAEPLVPRGEFELPGHGVEPVGVVHGRVAQVEPDEQPVGPARVERDDPGLYALEGVRSRAEPGPASGSTA